MPASRSITAQSFVFPSSREALVDVRAFIRGRCIEAAAAPSVADDVVLCVCEAAANAIQHSGGRLFRVTWRQHVDRVEVEVRDQGHFRRRMPDRDAEGVHGIALMASLMDELSLRRGTSRRPGTEVRMTKRLEPAEAPAGRRAPRGHGPGAGSGEPRVTLPEAPARSESRPPARGR